MKEISPWEIRLSPKYRVHLYRSWLSSRHSLDIAVIEQDETKKRQIVEDLECLDRLSDTVRGLVLRTIHPDTVLTAYWVDGISDPRIRQLHMGCWRAFFHLQEPPPRGEALTVVDGTPSVNELIEMMRD